MLCTLVGRDGELWELDGLRGGDAAAFSRCGDGDGRGQWRVVDDGVQGCSQLRQLRRGDEGRAGAGVQHARESYRTRIHLAIRGAQLDRDATH